MADKDRARHTWKSEVGHRLRGARHDARLSLQQVGNDLGYSKQLIGLWETGIQEPSAWNILQAARLYGCTTEWLMTGQLAAGQPNTQGTTAVPKVTSAGLRMMAEAFEMLPQISEERWRDFVRATFKARVGVPRARSYRAIAFDVLEPEHSLEPDILLGDTIVADPGTLPAHGERVLVVLIATNEILLRRYEPAKLAGKVEPPFRLLHTNQQIPTRDVDKKDRPFFAGSVVDIIQDLRAHSRRTPRLIMTEGEG